VFITINGKTHYLWRAVDQQGTVLDILVTSRRDTQAATRFFGKLLTGLRSVPRVLVTDKLASYGVAHRRLIPSVEHRRSKYLNNRAENSHQPTRARGTSEEKVPLPGRGTAVPFRVFRDLPALPAPPPPAHRSPAPARDDHPIHRLERGRRTAHRRLTTGTGSHFRGQHVQPPPTAKQPDNACGLIRGCPVERCERLEG
jgi:DDE domain